MSTTISLNTAARARTSFASAPAKKSSRAVARRCAVVADANAATRRQSLALFAASATLVATKPSFAAYGDSANVFGKVSNPTGFVPYAGDGYAFLLPSKYNPTKERPFPNTDCYFEDNFDQVTNISVIVEKSAKGKIEDYGKPEAYLEQLGYLLGVQSYAGQTRSEGGFAANKVSTAAVLDVFTRETKGKTYYMYEILTRTADGDEGGRHQLIAATVSDGTLYIMKLQSGDKRWFKGQERDLKTAWNSFTVA